MEQLLASPEVSPSPAPANAARVFGEHELIEVIGTGGMGVIWRARQRRLNRTVALKMIRAGLLATEADKKRFAAEAEAVANLEHPNIVSIHEVGECDGNLFFSMRLVEGESLAQRLERGRKTGGGGSTPTSGFAAVTAAKLVSTIARAVHHAHQRGILHRDLKPGNILLDRDGQPHVTDFGLAKRAGEESDLTMSGAVLGTPNYMAPEQASGRNRQLTTAADIYALGAILYELLTGRPPFQAETVLATLQQVIETEPAPPSSINHRTDRQLEIICLKCLAKEPARRYATAAELADDLERWLRSEPILARPTTPAERLVLWAKRRPAVAALSALAAALTITGAVAVLWQWREAVAQRQRADENASRTETALEQAKSALWQAQFDRARAQRQTRLMGQRVKTLEAIRAAVAIRPTAELRNEAIAALALPDLEPEDNWRAVPADTLVAASDPQLRHYALLTGTNRITLHRWADGRELFRVEDRLLLEPQLLFDGAGRHLVAYRDWSLRVWAVPNPQPVLALDFPDRNTRIRYVALSRDGQRLAYTDMANRLRVLDLTTGAQVAELTGLNTPWQCVFHPRLNQLAVECGSEVQLWDLAGPRLLMKRSIPPGGLGMMDWQADGRLLAIGFHRQQIMVWDTELNQSRMLIGHTREVARVWLHPAQSALMSFSWDNTLRLWDPVTGAQQLQTGGVMPAGFSADGGRIRVWRQPEGLGTYRFHQPGICRLLALGPEAKDISQVAFSPDSSLMIACGETGVWLWQMDKGDWTSFGAMPRSIHADFLDDNNVVSAGDNGLHVWPLQRDETSGRVSLGNPRPSPVDPRERLGSSALDSGRRRLVAHRSGTGTGVVLDLKGGKQPLPLQGQPWFSGPAFSPDGRWIASGCWDPVLSRLMSAAIWDAATGQMLTNFPTTKCTVTFSPDNRWLVLGANTEYRLLETGTWRQARTFARADSQVDCGQAAFSPDGKWLALHATDRVLRLINPLTGEEYARLIAPDNRILKELNFSPDGRWLAAATDANLQLWDLQLLRRELATLGLDWKDQ
jgi:eukaryotic-like serine/threonine-protein kinase